MRGRITHLLLWFELPACGGLAARFHPLSDHLCATNLRGPTLSREAFGQNGQLGRAERFPKTYALAARLAIRHAEAAKHSKSGAPG